MSPPDGHIVLIRRGRDFFLHMYTQRKSHVRTQREDSHLQLKQRALTRSWISRRLDLGLRKLREIHICRLNHPVYGALWWQWLRQCISPDCLPSLTLCPHPPPKLITSLTSQSPKPWIWESPKNASLSPDLSYLAKDFQFSIVVFSPRPLLRCRRPWAWASGVPPYGPFLIPLCRHNLALFGLQWAQPQCMIHDWAQPVMAFLSLPVAQRGLGLGSGQRDITTCLLRSRWEMFFSLIMKTSLLTHSFLSSWLRMQCLEPSSHFAISEGHAFNIRACAVSLT